MLGRLVGCFLTAGLWRGERTRKKHSILSSFSLTHQKHTHLIGVEKSDTHIFQIIEDSRFNFAYGIAGEEVRLVIDG
ncbi:hypothetical protein L6452_04585 [Arctium lappa]|uniref:Uncharacterized protein n=1 Tax=Arctium lappa TaxID=4217 RepID=A0ACB9EE09_ARCLA|nr:hypothetical protein L6452_04585 [Arctium lappa]